MEFLWELFTVLVNLFFLHLLFRLSLHHRPDDVEFYLLYWNISVLKSIHPTELFKIYKILPMWSFSLVKESINPRTKKKKHFEDADWSLNLKSHYPQ